MASTPIEADPMGPESIGQPVLAGYATELKAKIANLLGWKHDTFAGSQPVSFEKCHLDDLDREDYFVCEKSDGVRYMLFLVTTPKGAAGFLIDRKNSVRHLDLTIPLPHKHPMEAVKFHNETLIDGELVVDKDGDKRTLRYLAFDLMAANGVALTQRSYSTRLGILQQDVIKQYEHYYAHHPDLQRNVPFRIELKKQQRSYGMKLVLAEVPHLKHGNDGLIFTPVRTPYAPGTCQRLLKWKPPDQNTIDCKIKVLLSKERKPFYQLFVSRSGHPEEYAGLKPEPELLDKWRHHPPDGKIGEFRWDPEWSTPVREEGYAMYERKGGWRFVRFRDDKDTANDITVVERIWASIQDGVTSEMIESRMDSIRAHWKAREKGLTGPLSMTSPTKTGEAQSPVSAGGQTSNVPPTPAMEFASNPLGISDYADHHHTPSHFRRISTQSVVSEGPESRRASYDLDRRPSIPEAGDHLTSPSPGAGVLPIVGVSTWDEDQQNGRNVVEGGEGAKDGQGAVPMVIDQPPGEGDADTEASKRPVNGVTNGETRSPAIPFVKSPTDASIQVTPLSNSTTDDSALPQSREKRASISADVVTKEEEKGREVNSAQVDVVMGEAATPEEGGLGDDEEAKVEEAALPDVSENVENAVSLGDKIRTPTQTTTTTTTTTTTADAPPPPLTPTKPPTPTKMEEDPTDPSTETSLPTEKPKKTRKPRKPKEPKDSGPSKADKEEHAVAPNSKKETPVKKEGARKGRKKAAGDGAQGGGSSTPTSQPSTPAFNPLTLPPPP
ncbi:Dcp1p-Dcp2p decapping enzyme complex alpha subunit, partial [Rhizophlyctis rosea]